MDLILFFVIFIVVFAVIQSLFMLLQSGRFNPEVGRLRKEIKGLSVGRAATGSVDIVQKRTLSAIPWLNEALLGHKVPTLSRLEKLLTQGDVTQPLGSTCCFQPLTAAGAGCPLFPAKS